MYNAVCQQCNVLINGVLDIPPGIIFTDTDTELTFVCPLCRYINFYLVTQEGFSVEPVKE